MSQQNNNDGPGIVSHQQHGIGKLIQKINQEYTAEYGDILIDTSDGSLVNYVSSGRYRILENHEFSSGYSIKGGYLKPDGTKLILTTMSPDPVIVEFPLSIPYDLRTLGSPTSTTVPGDLGGIHFRPDGTRALAVYDGQFVNVNFSTAWDTTTISVGSGVSVNAVYGGGVHVMDNGTDVYMSDGQQIRKGTLSTQWDATTYSPLSGEISSITPTENSGDQVTGLAVNRDETYGYVGWEDAGTLDVVVFGEPGDVESLVLEGTSLNHNDSYASGSLTGFNDVDAVFLSHFDKYLYALDNSDPDRAVMFDKTNAF